MELFKSLRDKTKSYDLPFKHFELNEPLSDDAIKEIHDTHIPDPKKENLKYDGTRALDGGEGFYRQGIKDGGKAKKLRCYVTKKNSNKFPHLTKFIKELQSQEVYKMFGSLIGKDLSNSYVRLEVICDREGFWLKPHCDIQEKLMSSLVFVNLFNESENLGTDLYNKELKRIKTVPYRNNYGYLFTTGPQAWHGMEKKEIKKERRSLLINYVTFKTDWRVKN